MEHLNATLARAARMTDNNDHNGAVKTVAKRFGHAAIVAEITTIQKHHKRLGHMPMDLITRRNAARDAMLDLIECHYGSDLRDAVHDCF